MKYRYLIVLTTFLFGYLGSGLAQASKKKPTAPAKQGFNIQVQIQPYRNTWLYLACYYGSIKTMVDSAFVNKEGRGIFSGKEKLPEGVYILVSPQKSILTDFLIGKQQHFSIVGDTLNLDESLKITGSTDNYEFLAYTSFVGPKAKQAELLNAKMTDATEAARKEYAADLQKLSNDILNYRKQAIQKSPNSLLSLLFKGMQATNYPEKLQHPKTKQDSLLAYQYGKEHYWDGVDFTDGRLVRTPMFDARMKDYFKNWVSASPDSIIYEQKWMMAYGRNDAAMQRYLISYFIDNYIYPKIMGQDRVFLYTYNTYIGDPSKVDWLNEKQLKTIRDRALMIMANQIGEQAWDLELVDTSGKVQTLFQTTGQFTVVVFWDVHCGRCKEELPTLDSMYQASWKGLNVAMYAIMINEEALADWKGFIDAHTAGWTHVHQTLAMRQEEEKAGKPNFRQLYDITSTPTLFLLDEKKKIIAKNISLHDLDSFIQRSGKKQ